MTDPKVLPCPCCAGKAHYTMADTTIRQPDRVMCLGCGLEIENALRGVALQRWNERAQFYKGDTSCVQ